MRGPKQFGPTESKIGSYMVKSPYVASTDQSMQEAYDYMRECNIRHLPVIDDGELVGLISERDVKEAQATGEGKKLKVEDVMKRDVYVVQKSADLSEVVSVMAENKLGSVVIVDRYKNVVGIFTTTDALKILASLLDEEDEAPMRLDDEFFESWPEARYS